VTVLLKEKGERGLLEGILERIRSPSCLGPGDDAAVVPLGEQKLVISSDVVTFERHRPEGTSFREFGWMAAAVNFSDIAAMGATPKWLIVSMAVPPELDEDDVYEMMIGIDKCAEFCGAEIIGGDTKTGNGTICCTAVGTMTEEPMKRSGARPGDIVLVTGTLGSPAAGMAALKNGADEEDAMRSLRLPIPRVDEGREILKVGATSCMDLSDGLATAMHGICESSSVGMDVLWEALPEGPGVNEMCQYMDKEQMMLYFGGEYELLFTVPKNKMNELHALDIDVSVIGIVTESREVCMIKDGERKEVVNGGYEHFKD
jgi:thiamine-monophosphate kinase